MANRPVLRNKSNDFENIVYDYFIVTGGAAVIGTILGLIIAVALGETYTVETDNFNYGPDRVGEFHMIDNSGDNETRFTATGGKWIGGGAGVGALLGFVLYYLYRNFGSKQVNNASSSSSSKVINAYAQSTSVNMQGGRRYHEPIVSNNFN